MSSSKAINLAKETGARLHIFHISTAKELSLFRNDIPLKDKKITAEVCAHHLWFSSKDYESKGTFIKWNPAIKTENDREALWEGLSSDLLDVLATDHAPHTKEEKLNIYSKSPSGGPLVQHALPALLTAFNEGKITLEKIVQKACHNPAILFNVKDRGYLKEGYYADLVVLDINKEFEVLKVRLKREGQRYFDESIQKYSLDAVLSINNYHAAYAAAAHYPCLTVPMGYRDSGVPTNLTFIGPSFSENKLYQLGLSLIHI